MILLTNVVVSLAYLQLVVGQFLGHDRHSLRNKGVDQFLTEGQVDLSAVSHSLEHVDCPDTDSWVGHVGSDGTDASLAPLTAVFVSLQPVGRWKYIHSYVSERTFMDESKIFYVSVSYLPQSSALAHVDVCAESLDGGGISKPSSLHISPIHQEQLALVVVNVTKPVLEQLKFLIYLFL